MRKALETELEAIERIRHLRHGVVLAHPPLGPHIDRHIIGPAKRLGHAANDFRLGPLGCELEGDLAADTLSSTGDQGGAVVPTGDYAKIVARLNDSDLDADVTQKFVGV